MAAKNLTNQGTSRAGQAGRASREGNTAEEMREQVSEYWNRGTTRLRGMTEDHEGTAVVMALAAGFGIGVLIGYAMAPSEPRHQRWTDRLTDRAAAEGLGRRIMERLESMMPDMISERFSS